MKKYTIFVAGICLLSAEMVNAGWYAGANLGLNAVTINKSLLYPVNSSSPTTASYKSAYTNFHGQLLGGYDLALTNALGLALELNADLFTGKAQYVINNWFLDASATAQEKLKYGFGAFVLPEYRYHNLRFFAGPGISTGKFSINYGNTGGNIGVSQNASRQLMAWGIKVGVGSYLSATTEALITYQFNQYESTSWSAVEPLSQDTLSGRYKPAVNLFMVGLRTWLN